MTTTPETIARLRRLHAESETMAGMHEYTSAACHALPGLLDDLEAAQNVLRDVLAIIPPNPTLPLVIDIRRRIAALATEAK